MLMWSKGPSMVGAHYSSRFPCDPPIKIKTQIFSKRNHSLWHRFYFSWDTRQFLQTRILLLTQLNISWWDPLVPIVYITTPCICINIPPPWPNENHHQYGRSPYVGLFGIIWTIIIRWSPPCEHYSSHRLYTPGAIIASPYDAISYYTLSSFVLSIPLISSFM